MPPRIVLRVMSGPIRGKVFEFDGHDTFIFGRGKECHAQLPYDGYVSRHHFLLEVNPPEAAIRDLGSLNGTHVNGVRYGGRVPKSGTENDGGPPPLVEVSLKDGDLIAVGNTAIRVRIAVPASSQVAVPPPLPPGPGKSKGRGRLYVPTETESDALAAESKPPAAAEGPRPGIAGGGPVAHPPLASRDNPAADAGSQEAGGLRALIRQAARDYGTGQKIEIEGYELGQILGRGGMGIVYKAVRKADEFPVAVKFMLAKVAVKEKARRRFLREIDVIRELNHPNIVSLIDSGATNNAFYFIAEYCSGGSLSDLASRRGGRLPLQILGPVLLQCLEGLDHAHGRGFVHRDIKPGNILLQPQERGWTAKLGDFGLAKQFEQAGFSGMTLTGACGGTYDYMPREQLTDFKNSKPVSDVWSIGATCYRLLTGTTPRPCPEGRDPMEVVLREEHVPIRQRDPSVPPKIARVIDMSLAVDVADRFKDAGEMRRAFGEALT